MTKQFKLRREDIEPLASGHGGCTATDGIVVDGRLVGVMIRHTTDRPNDSGWTFEGAGEDPDQLNDPARWGVYDVNTIANYDPMIIPHLDAAVGTVCLRDSDGTIKQMPYVIAKGFLER